MEVRKGKIIQEFLRISKIPFMGISLEAIQKNRQIKSFFSINLLRNFSLILFGEKKRGKDFRLFFFFIFYRSRTVLGDFMGKSFFFSIDLSAKL